MQQQTKTLFIIAGVIILVLIGYVLYSSLKTKPTVEPATTTQPTATDLKPRSDVSVTQAEVNDIGSSFKLPAGFPSIVPVEKTSIVESYSAYYEKHKATQYTISYETSKTIAQKWDEYNDFMTKNGYTIAKDTSSKSKGVISGTKTGENLLVVINTQNNGTVVHLTLLRQE